MEVRKGTVYVKKGWIYIAFYPAPGAKRKHKATGLRDTAENRKRVAAALSKRKDHVEAVAAVDDEAGPLTVRRWAKKWIEMRRAQGVLSVDDEARMLRAHVLPGIGDQLLNEVRPRNLIDLFGALRRKKVARGSSGNLSPKYIYNIYGAVGSMFRDAKLEDVLLGDSPCILKKRQLGENVDKNPEWRPTAKFGRAELELLVGDARVPQDRRVLYALEGLAALRHGEAAGLRWRHYDAAVQPLGRLMVATSYDKGRTKTAQVRMMPVHPTLAAILAEWKLGGWAATFGREPGPDDLVVPLPADAPGKRARANPRAGGGMRNKNDSRRRLQRDLAQLALRHRRGHDLRRTMISLAQDDGARKDVLKLGTHGRTRRDAIDDYTTLEWETLCREVAKLQVQRRAVTRVVVAMGGAGGDGPVTLLPEQDSRGHETHVDSATPRAGAAGSRGNAPVAHREAAPGTTPLLGSTPGVSTMQLSVIPGDFGQGNRQGNSSPAAAKDFNGLESAADELARVGAAVVGGEATLRQLEAALKAYAKARKGRRAP